MKKFISMMMVAALVCVMSIPCFAATQTKADLLALVGKAPAEYQAQATSTINAMTEAQAAVVDVATVKAEAKAIQAKEAAGTLTMADITNAQAAVQKATGVAIAVANVSVSNGKVYATVTTAINGKASTSAYSAPVSPNPGPLPVTPTPAPGKGNGVIKTTGVDVASSALILVIAMVSVLGVATIKTRKADANA
ncbi:MAG: hypothetical protein RSC58_01695 [Ruthenibacterium sp.]